MKFTNQEEQHNSVNFMDLTIHHKRTELELEMCRKPTQRDVIMLNDSCHQHKHKHYQVLIT